MTFSFLPFLSRFLFGLHYMSVEKFTNINLFTFSGKHNYHCKRENRKLRHKETEIKIFKGI